MTHSYPASEKRLADAVGVPFRRCSPLATTRTGRPKGAVSGGLTCFILAILVANTMAITHDGVNTMKTSFDPLTRDLFEVPVEVVPVPGSLDCGRAIRHVLSDLMKRSTHSRQAVAEAMSTLTGAAISKHQLDSWTAESRDGWRFPLEYVPAFEVAVETREADHLAGRCARLQGAGGEGGARCRDRQAGADQGRRGPAHPADQGRDGDDAMNTLKAHVDQTRCCG
jgi:hypothetical protein